MLEGSTIMAVWMGVWYNSVGEILDLGCPTNWQHSQPHIHTNNKVSKWKEFGTLTSLKDAECCKNKHIKMYQVTLMTLERVYDEKTVDMTVNS